MTVTYRRCYNVRGRLRLSKALHMRLAASSKSESGRSDEDYDTYWFIHSGHNRKTQKPPLQQVTVSGVSSNITSRELTAKCSAFSMLIIPQIQRLSRRKNKVHEKRKLTRPVLCDMLSVLGQLLQEVLSIMCMPLTMYGLIGIVAAGMIVCIVMLVAR